jgi:hypothetical protein
VQRTGSESVEHQRSDLGRQPARRDDFARHERGALDRDPAPVLRRLGGALQASERKFEDRACLLPVQRTRPKDGDRQRTSVV